MNNRISEIFEGHAKNYILPFFWLHGADEKVLRNCMEKIDSCGIKAVCLESRPHLDFVGAGWWRDLDIIIDEAKKRDMRLWLLDDSHFPTGYANGKAVNAPEHLKRWSLIEKKKLVEGPSVGCRFAAAVQMGYDYLDKGKDIHGESFREELVAVIIGRRVEKDGEIHYTKLEDVTDKVQDDGWLQMDFAEGSYCIFTYTKRLGAALNHNNYISMLEKDSVKILIDAVYEPHYNKYKEEFGKTIAGFFSDEPGFYNMPDDLYKPGEIGDDMPLPWTDDVKNQFKMITTKGADLSMLVGLYNLIEGKERQARYTYMDIITKKYQENFSEQLGDWCSSHKVEYIGHVLEDGLFQQSLGPGTGHYFRALHGQHMGGIDIVLNNLLPEQDYGDGFFTHYELPVIGASIAQQNELMKGRSICEIFGAFGWSESMFLMKWMADHMMVNGINWFVPHAFSDKEFPDNDNPPQFYAQGNNPLYSYMSVLFGYMNRVCHLFNNGRAVVDVAVFFPAEASWLGGSRSVGHIGRICMQNQIPYHILCMDNLREAEIKEGLICVGKSQYKRLYVDSIEFLPKEYLEVIDSLIKKGANIHFVNKVPDDIQGNKVSNEASISEETMMSQLNELRVCQPDRFAKWLRCYRYTQENMTIIMLANSSVSREIDDYFTIQSQGDIVGYDALNDEIFELIFTNEGKVHLHLDKGESCILFVGDELDIAKIKKMNKKRELDATTIVWTDYAGEYKLSLAKYNRQECFKPFGVKTVLEDLAKWEVDFAGIIRYEMTFNGKKDALLLEQCYGPVKLIVNGHLCHTRISYPYFFDISEYTLEGANHIRLEVATTLGNLLKDSISLERAIEPLGIIGAVKLGERIDRNNML